MLYSLEQDKTEKSIIETCRREKLPLPNKIANAPQLLLGLELYYSSFIDLCTSRTGMGDGPISWIIVEEYGIINKFTEEQKEDLHFFISCMDEAYMKWSRSKNGNSR